MASHYRDTLVRPWLNFSGLGALSNIAVSDKAKKVRSDSSTQARKTGGVFAGIQYVEEARLSRY